MKSRHLLVFLCAGLLAAPAWAQTKISGTLKCSKGDPSYGIPLADKPGHAFGLEKTPCTWTKPMEMAGEKTKDGASVGTAEVMGNESTGNGYHTGTMGNGDTYNVKFHGATKMKDGVVQSGHGEWSFTGGTGKLKGLKGKGTYKGTANPDGSITYDVEGEYQLP